VGNVQGISGISLDRLNGKLICGYTAKNQLLIDLDNCSYYKAYCLARMIQREWPFVGDCLIVRCAPDSHHLVFSSRISWSKISRILDVLCGLKILEKDYMKIRKFRRDLTLRISPKLTEDKNRGTPIPIAYLLNGKKNRGDNLILNYLEALSCFKPELPQP
jgi:hypothetical protein